MDYGAHLALGSDAPVESPNPFLGLHAAVTRRRADGSPSADGWYPEQKLTMAEAWEGYTLGPAYAASMENRLGRLAPNYLADLIVLEKDPLPATQMICLPCSPQLQWWVENGFGKHEMPDQNRLTPEMLVPRMGEYLIHKGLISAENIQKALAHQQEETARGNTILLGQALIDLNLISRADLDQAVTEQIIQLRSALQASNRTLERRVEERTAELQKALERVSELSQLKANFISNISHELRTPLTHIKGYIELLVTESLGPLTEEQQHALQVSQQTTTRLETLIDDLIMVSLASRGELSIKQKCGYLPPGKPGDQVPWGDSSPARGQSAGCDR